MQLVHPLLNPVFLPGPYQVYIRKSKGMGDAVADSIQSIFGSISGLTDAIGAALNDVVNTVVQILQTVTLIVEAIIGQVSWDKVLGSLGKIFNDIGGVMVNLNPLVLTNNLLASMPLTSHAFYELNLYTGGIMVNVANVSSVTGRALSGEKISPAEMITDALTILEAMAIVFGSPVALGVMVGAMVGRDICAAQTSAKDACNAAFMIIGAAVGSYAGGVSWAGGATDAVTDPDADPFVDDGDGTNYNDANPEGGGDTVPEGSGTVDPGSDVVDAGSDATSVASTTASAGTNSFVTALENASVQFLEQKGIQLATRQAIAWCQANHWAGSHECTVLAQITADFVQFGLSDEDWTQFLATEAVKIGVTELLLNWFPPKSPEYIAIYNAAYPPVLATHPAVVPAKPAVITAASIPYLVLLGAAGLFFVGSSV